MGQCGINFNFSDSEDVDYLLIAVNDSVRWYEDQEEVFIPSGCESFVTVKIEAPFYASFDTSFYISNHVEHISVHLVPEYGLQDTIVLHAHENKSITKEEVQDLLEKENINSSSELFSTFSAINMTGKSTGINKPVMRFFHSNRLSVLEYKLPIRDHYWGLDHGLETGLSHIYGVNYNLTSSSIYGDYGALFLNSDVFKEVQHSKINIGYNHVNRRKNIGFSVPFYVKKRYFNLSFDLADSENFRVPTTTYNYLGSYYSLNEKQLSNTGKRENFVSLEMKKDKKTSFGITNKWSKTGLFSGGLGKARSYDLINQRQIETPYQTVNHLKVHGHYKNHIGEETELYVDAALQNNRRKEFENAANHGYNPLTEDSLGVSLDFTNFDFLMGLRSHLDSVLCLTMENSVNLGRNTSQGFDFIIPSYNQFEDRFWIDLETINNQKRTFKVNFTTKVKTYAIESAYVTMYQGANVIGDINTAEEAQKAFVSMDLFLQYHQMIKDNLVLDISASTIGRSPEINELSAFGAHHGSFRFEKGNSNLRNERSVNIQSVLAYTKKNLNIRLSSYWYEFQNYIYLSPSSKFATATVNDSLIALPVTGQVYDYKQNKVRTFGSELDVDYQIGNWKWEAQGFITYAQNLDTDLPLPFVAPVSMVNKISYKKSKIGVKWRDWETKIIFVNNLKQSRVDRNEKETPSSFVCNLHSSISFLRGESKVDLSIGVNNLFNQVYFAHLSQYRILDIPEPARNVYARVSYKF